MTSEDLIEGMAMDVMRGQLAAAFADWRESSTSRDLENSQWFDNAIWDLLNNHDSDLTLDEFRGQLNAALSTWVNRSPIKPMPSYNFVKAITDLLVRFAPGKSPALPWVDAKPEPEPEPEPETSSVSAPAGRSDADNDLFRLSSVASDMAAAHHKVTEAIRYMNIAAQAISDIRSDVQFGVQPGDGFTIYSIALQDYIDHLTHCGLQLSGLIDRWDQKQFQQRLRPGPSPSPEPDADAGIGAGAGADTGSPPPITEERVREIVQQYIKSHAEGDGHVWA